MKRSLSYSVFFGFCCLTLCCVGCSGSKAPSAESEARGSLALQAAIDSYGAVTHPEVQGYLYYISTRLIAGLSAVEKNCPKCDLTLLNTRKPLAYSPGPGHIVLSSGMLLRLQNEAELAFVVAHEMAHQVLGHHAELEAEGSAEITALHSDTKRSSLEEEADLFAVGLLAVSGYDPRYATTALLNAYGKTALDGQPQGYPELQHRQQQVQDAIARANWRPPGTVTRREFEKIRRMLLANPTAR